MKPLAIFTGMVVLVAGSVLGHPHPRSPVEMELLVNGRSIGGSSGGTVVVPVRRLGCEYVLRIRNHSPVAMEAVVSVDGLSVINGRRASQSIRGYLIQPNATVEIPGWRRGNRKVAAFKFSREEDSYAYRTGRPDGIGVIRLTAYEEARKAYARRRSLQNPRGGSGPRPAPRATRLAGGMRCWSQIESELDTVGSWTTTFPAYRFSGGIASID